MTLAEAIRKGAQQRPQIFCRMFSWVGKTLQGSCVLGAAWEGQYGAPTFVDSPMDIVGAQERSDLDVFPEFGQEFPKFSCPVNGQCGVPTALETVLIHLNDYHRWTRERIADWVEAVTQ